MDGVIAGEDAAPVHDLEVRSPVSGRERCSLAREHAFRTRR
jgi:hypothetical protein